MSIYVWDKEIKNLYAWWSISISDIQWPAPDGFHVPLTTEWKAVYDVWTALGGWSSDWTNFWIALKLPFAGNRTYSSASVDNQGSRGRYWSSTPSDSNNAYALGLSSSSIGSQYYSFRSTGYSVRCFKNSPTIPTSSWTKLYWTSIEAGWIFWSSTDWLISLSSDWTTWITIADKNLWATTVWNSWDTLSEANCGKYYQRWNNYWFPRTWTIANLSSTQVDASSYWPWNYYSSDTFIKYTWRWDTTDNWNLWWWVSQWTSEKAKEAKAVYLWDIKVRPIDKRTFTISRTEKSDMSSWWTYSDDAAWLTAWDTAFDEFFWYYGCRLNTSGVETAKVTQEESWWAWKLDITKLWTLTSWDNVMIAFPKMWYKMSKSWSTVTLSLTKDPNKASEWYKYYAFTKWSIVKDVLYLWAYEMTENYTSLSWKAPLAKQTRSAFRSWVQNKYWASSWYSIMTYRPRDFIKMLYMMKYGNPDSQTVIWKWLTSWSSAANTWATNSITNATWATNTSNTWRIKLYWLEDIWWNVSEWMDWCHFNSSKHLTVDNTNSVFQDSAYSTDLWVASSWYMMTIDWSTDWTFKNTSSSAASSSTYYCDRYSANTDRVLYAGGYYSNGDYSGIFYVGTYTATDASANHGSRLQFL